MMSKLENLSESDIRTYLTSGTDLIAFSYEISRDEDIRRIIDRRRNIMEAFKNVGTGELRELSLETLEFLLVTATYSDEVEKLKPIIQEKAGIEYEERLDIARKTAWQGFSSQDFGDVKKIQHIMEENKGIRLTPPELNDCRSPEAIKRKLELFDRLTKGNLQGFYSSPGVHLFDLDKYQLRLIAGSWQNAGGIELLIMEGDHLLMRVGGRIHNYTDINEIRGAKNESERIKEFGVNIGIHPANIDLLLFLKLSQCLSHDRITIIGSASRAFNCTDQNSELYKIPKYYFRLKLNDNTGMYEFNGEKRDIILKKFSDKNEAVKICLVSMDKYMQECNV